MALSTFVMLFNHRQYRFPSQTETLYILDNNCPFPLSHQPLRTSILLSIPVNLLTVGAPWEWNYIVFVFLCLARFT